LFFKVYKKTNISVTNEIGLKYFGSIETAVLTPIAAPAREKANSFSCWCEFYYYITNL